MNKYIIPICNIDKSRSYIKTIVATSYDDCQEKLIEDLIDAYDVEESINSYTEFIDILNTNYDIIIGDIKDIEEI